MIYSHLAAALVAAVLAAGTAWKVQDWRHDAAEKGRLEGEAKERGIRLQRVDTAAVRHETDKTQIRTEFLVITEKVEHALQSDFYSVGQPACLDDDGLRAVTEAARPAAAASQPAAAVSRPAATD